MAWKVIGKIGSLCLMMIFLATGAMAQSTPDPDPALRLDVFNAFEAAGIPLESKPFMDLEDAGSNIDIWNVYVDAFAIANPPGLPDPTFTYCVVSRTNDDSSC